MRWRAGRSANPAPEMGPFISRGGRGAPPPMPGGGPECQRIVCRPRPGYVSVRGKFREWRERPGPVFKKTKRASDRKGGMRSLAALDIE